MIKKLFPLLLALGFGAFEYRIKRIASGIGLMILSGFFLLLASLCGVITLFFALADMDRLIIPTLITGGITILIAILTFIEGKRMMHKKPLLGKRNRGV